MADRGGAGAVVGFGGVVESWRDVLALSAGDVLELDGTRSWRAAAGAMHEAVVVSSWTAVLGDVPSGLATAREVLVPGGVLILDVADRPAFGELVIDLEQLLLDVELAGLTVRDVLRVNDPRIPEPPPRAAPLRRLLLAERPPTDAPPPAGTVVIGPGRAADRERTRRALAAWLPADWEVLEPHAAHDPEHVAFNAGVAASRGELVWLLAAGTEPDAVWFDCADAQARCGRWVAPVAADTSADVDGLLASRRTWLAHGPFAASWRTSTVAYEDFGLSLSARDRSERVTIPAAWSRAARGRSPESSSGGAAALVRDETSTLLRRWRAACDGVEAAMPRAAIDGRPAPADPRISLCMIVRDEERFLDACLAAARSAVDEIVVVDTGSTDRTVDIARAHGALVVHEPWGDDFAAARNASLQRATGDWVLVLDADEVLRPDAPARLREAARVVDVLAWHLTFVNDYGDGRPPLEVLMPRLFRRLPGARYENRIHEQVMPSLARCDGAGDLRTATCAGVVVDHVGYRDDVARERGKDDRNERLFRKQLADAPGDVYTLYKFGDFLRRFDDVARRAEARSLLQSAFDRLVEAGGGRPLHVPFAGEVAALLALELARDASRRAEARSVVDRALARFDVTPNLCYVAALLRFDAGAFDDAIRSWTRCLTWRADRPLVVPVQDGITGAVALRGLAQAWRAKDCPVRAARWQRAACALGPTAETTAPEPVGA